MEKLFVRYGSESGISILPGLRVLTLHPFGTAQGRKCGGAYQEGTEHPCPIGSP